MLIGVPIVGLVSDSDTLRPATIHTNPASTATASTAVSQRMEASFQKSQSFKPSFPRKREPKS